MHKMYRFRVSICSLGFLHFPACAGWLITTCAFSALSVLAFRYQRYKFTTPFRHLQIFFKKRLKYFNCTEIGVSLNRHRSSLIHEIDLLVRCLETGSFLN